MASAPTSGGLFPHQPLVAPASTQELAAIAQYFRAQPWFADLKRNMCQLGMHDWRITSPPPNTGPPGNFGCPGPGAYATTSRCDTCGLEKRDGTVAPSPVTPF